MYTTLNFRIHCKANFILKIPQAKIILPFKTQTCKKTGICYNFPYKYESDRLTPRYFVPMPYFLSKKKRGVHVFHVDNYEYIEFDPYDGFVRNDNDAGVF